MRYPNPHRTRTPLFLTLPLAALPLLACSGSTTQQPPPATEPAGTAQTTPATQSDPELADAPAGAAVVVVMDGRALRQSPLYGRIRQALTDTQQELAGCGSDPLALIDRATYADSPDDSFSIVLRGAIAAAEHEDCARAVLARFPVEGAEPERVGGAIFVAEAPVAQATRAALSGGPSAASSPMLTALHAQAPGEGVVGMVDFDAWRPQVGGVREPPPGMDQATAERLVGSFHGGVFTLVAPADGSLALTLHGEFNSAEDAGAFNDWFAGRFTAFAGELRDRLTQPFPQPALEQYRPGLLGALDHVISASHFSTRGAAVHTTMLVDADGVQTIASAAVPAVRAYTAATKTAEARMNLALIAHAASAYAGQHAAQRPVPPPPRRGRRGASIPPPPPSPFPPSAPRTPADVPRGTRVVDPPSVWENPTWRALSFSLEDPHYYSYEFVNQGNAFTVRAYGDLDGDGTLSTFEVSGHIEPNGEVVIDGDVRATNELE